MNRAISRSVVPRKDYFHTYDYYQVDEDEVEELVLESDADTMWRIGDGIAPSYNFIYRNVERLAEYETFHSSQIREGMLTREEGLRLVERENQPRHPSLKRCTEIVDLDFASTIQTINRNPNSTTDSPVKLSASPG